MVCWFLGGWERLLSNENKVQKRNVELGNWGKGKGSLWRIYLFVKVWVGKLVETFEWLNPQNIESKYPIY